jgi:hypothetical protein
MRAGRGDCPNIRSAAHDHDRLVSDMPEERNAIRQIRQSDAQREIRPGH